MEIIKQVPALEMRGISKSFGSVRANHDVNFTLDHGEIHALLGENGSGKSTLMNILSGIYSPDSGMIMINGTVRQFHSPKDAISQKIGMVHQHFRLMENMLAWENVQAGTAGAKLDRKNPLNAWSRWPNNIKSALTPAKVCARCRSVKNKMWRL